jgi:hypothetical protein
MPVQRSVDPDALAVEQASLPHGGTIDGYRRERAQWALLMQRRALELARLDGSPARLQAMVAESAANAWGVVALLGWLERQFGPGTAWRAAAMLQDITLHADTWDDSLLDVPGLDGAGDPPGWTG